ADAPSSRLQFPGSLKSKTDDPVGHSDVHFPDLSAFLSQEELDKSVDLARQAIGHEYREDRAEANTSVTPSSPSNPYSFTAVPLANHSAAPFAAPTNQPVPELNRPAAHISFTPDRKMHRTSSGSDGMIRNSRDSGEGINDLNRAGRNAPYNLETQSKKEFLNKAADFIEELSSLFKANSSKRVRPRACKSHRSRTQNKSLSDGSFDPLNEDTRERVVTSTEDERERPYTAVGHQTEDRPEPGTETPYPTEPECEPPQFIQKLRSREIAEGSKVQLDCIVRGLPPPEVRWFCEGKELENSPDIQILNNGELHSLIISEAFEEDTGRYSCFASNVCGTDSTSAEIYVEGASSSDSEGEHHFEHIAQSLVPPAQAATTATSLPLNAVSSVPPILTLPTQTSHPEVEPIRPPTVIICKPVMAAPVFTKNLQDVYASCGQLVALECRVRGVPSPRVVWYRDESQMEDSPDFRILQKKPRSPAESEEICTLVIAEVFPEDSGMFTCTASNKFGTVSSTAALRVKGASNEHPSVMSSGNGNSDAVVPLPDPPPNSCLKSGALTSHKDPRASSRVGLRVHFKLPEDEEEAQSDASCQSEDAAQMSAKEPPPVRAKPKLLKKTVPKARPSSTDKARESKEILLHEIEKKLQLRDSTPHFAHQQKLSVEGKTASRPLGSIFPATVINYDEPGQALSVQEYKVSSFEQRLMSEIEFRLERTPVEESDEEVQHDDVPTGKCIVPIFDKKLKNFKAMEGVPVTFSCKIVGIPVPKVYWFKDGKQILKKNVHYKKIRDGDGTCALHIESTTSDDDGNYTVMAANPQGRISCSGHLIVQTGPPRPRCRHFILRGCMNIRRPLFFSRVQSCVREAEGEEAQERFFKPHFLQAPGDMLAHEGKLCRLDCKVSGLPAPELMWLVNGKPIYPDLYHKMLVRENGVHSLVIDPLTQKDAGTYTCIASNKAGQSSFSLELKVVEKAMKYPPQFLEKLQNMGIPEGTPVRLECRVVGMPPPVIFWKKDNDSIPNTKERITMTQDATGYVCLLIQPTRKDDAGWYTVSAKNEAGIVSCTCRLDIYGSRY
uniref:Myopalladin n=1 Tax=Tetraodon nigroviridis TaxID=99883 RepID=H3D6D5_TETNG